MIALVAWTCGCANPGVAPERLPPAPSASLAGERVALLTEGMPPPMLEELRAFAASSDAVREVASGASGPRAADALAEACGEDGELVLAGSLLRRRFTSNAPDRNTLFVYETAVIVGIPVTLVSAYAWRWWSETLVEAQLLARRCGGPDAAPIRESHQLRSEGRGFVRTEPLREAQVDAATRAVTRELLARCSESASEEEVQK